MSKGTYDNDTVAEVGVGSAAGDLAGAAAEVGAVTPLVHSPVVTGEAAGATDVAAEGNEGISDLGAVAATEGESNANGPSVVAIAAPASLDVTAGEGAGTLTLSGDLTPGVAAIAEDTGVDAETIIAATKILGEGASLVLAGKLNSSLVLGANGAVATGDGEAAPALDLGTVGEGSAITLAASAAVATGDGEAAVDGSGGGATAAADGEAAVEARAEEELDAIASALGATVLDEGSCEDDSEGEGSGEDTSNVAAGNQDGAEAGEALADADVSLSGDVATGDGATA